LTNDGVPPNYEAMKARMQRIEERLTRVETDLAIIKSNYVTKEDLHREIAALTWRLVTFVCGFGVALVSSTYFIAAHV
jgi:hypothetical protein